MNVLSTSNRKKMIMAEISDNVTWFCSGKCAKNTRHTIISGGPLEHVVLTAQYTVKCDNCGNSETVTV